MDAAQPCALCIGTAAASTAPPPAAAPRVALRVARLAPFFPPGAAAPLYAAHGTAAAFLLAAPAPPYAPLHAAHAARAALQHALAAAVDAGRAATLAAALAALAPAPAALLAARPDAALGAFAAAHRAAAPALFAALAARADAQAAQYCRTSDAAWNARACHACGRVPLHRAGQTPAALGAAARALMCTCRACGRHWCVPCAVQCCGPACSSSSSSGDDEDSSALREWCVVCRGACTCRACRQRARARRRGACVEAAVRVAGSADAVPRVFARPRGAPDSSRGDSDGSSDKPKHEHKHEHKHHKHHKHASEDTAETVPGDVDGEDKKKKKKSAAAAAAAATTAEKEQEEHGAGESKAPRRVYPIADDVLERETNERLALKNRAPRPWPQPAAVPVPAHLSGHDYVFVWNFLSLFGEHFGSPKFETLAQLGRTLFPRTLDEAAAGRVARLHSGILNAIASPEDFRASALAKEEEEVQEQGQQQQQDDDNDGNEEDKRGDNGKEAAMQDDSGGTGDKPEKDELQWGVPERCSESTCWEMLARYLARCAGRPCAAPATDEACRRLADQLHTREYWQLDEGSRLALLRLLCTLVVQSAAFHDVVDAAVASGNSARADKKAFKRRYEEELAALKSGQPTKADLAEPERARRRKEVRRQHLEKQHEAEMQRFHARQRRVSMAVRTELLGTDRHGRRYWLLLGEVLGVHDGTADRWFACSDEQQLAALRSWLNDKGVNEKALLEAIATVEEKIRGGFETAQAVVLAPPQDSEPGASTAPSEAPDVSLQGVSIAVQALAADVRDLVELAPVSVLRDDIEGGAVKRRQELLEKLGAADLAGLKQALLEFEGIVGPSGIEDSSWGAEHRGPWRKMVEGSLTVSHLALCFQVFETVLTWSPICRICKQPVVLEGGGLRGRQAHECCLCHRKYHSRCLNTRVLRCDAARWVCPACQSEQPQPASKKTPPETRAESSRAPTRCLPERRAKKAAQDLTREMLEEQRRFDKRLDREESESSDDFNNGEDDDDNVGVGSRRLEQKRRRIEEQQQELDEKSARLGLRKHVAVDYRM